jgi:hypothetical protein
MSDASGQGPGAPGGAEGQGQGPEGQQGQQGAPQGAQGAEGQGDARQASPEATQLAEARQADRAKAQRIRALEAELENTRRQGMSEQDKAIAEATTAARAAAETEWSGRYLKLRLERLAATKLADPSDAVSLLDTSEFTHETPDGDIAKRIDELLVAKPYLAAKPSGLAPQLDRGPQNGQPKPGTDMNALLRSRRG